MIEARLGPEPDWEKVSREWERSGQNQREFCRQRGYSYSRFKTSRGKLGHCRPRARRTRKVEDGSPGSLSFLPVSVEPSGDERRVAHQQTQEVEVELPFGVVLRFRGIGHGHEVS